jgi:hypothetical protein
MLSNYKSISVLIHRLGQSPHDPIISQWLGPPSLQHMSLLRGHVISKPLQWIDRQMLDR